jgi:hypothetical protein
MYAHNDLRRMTDTDFALFGMEQVAYVKPVTLENGEAGFAIHTADGREAAVLADRDRGRPRRS